MFLLCCVCFLGQIRSCSDTALRSSGCLVGDASVYCWMLSDDGAVSYYEDNGEFFSMYKYGIFRLL